MKGRYSIDKRLQKLNNQGYFLCDVHFHTNQSFDAYENKNHNSFNDEYLDKLFGSDNRVNLVCKTDHNILGFDYFKELHDSFEKKYQTKLLPGIEVSSDEDVHWIFIFNDEELLEDEGRKGEALDKGISKLTEIDPTDENYHNKSEQFNHEGVEIEDFISRLNDVCVEYLAIPHLVKHKGLFREFKNDDKALNAVKYLISDNIIVGFESKNQEKEITSRIKETEHHIKEEIEKLDSQKTNDCSGLKRRQKYKSRLDEIETIIGETSLIYGSDHHGENSYNYNQLFYMKANPTFEGLKLSLIDPMSRVYSHNRLEKYDKSANFIVRKMNLNVNEEEKTIELGDGLNSIIGPRGSGKSYLLSLLIGASERYKDSSIAKQITMNSIECDGGEGGNTKLTPQQYDFISQKHMATEDGEKKNIYDVLAEAPYSYKKFQDSLREMLGESETESRSDSIKQFIEKSNTLIDKYVDLYTLQNAPLDLSYVSKYNELYKDENHLSKTNTIFKDFVVYLEKNLTRMEKRKSNINELKENANKTMVNLEQVFKDTFVERIDVPVDYESLSENLEGLIEKFYPVYINTLKESTKRIDRVNKRANNIVRRLRNEMNNIDRIMTDNITQLRDWIRKSSFILSKCYELESEIEDVFIEGQKGELTAKDVYTFTVADETYEIKVIKTLKLSDLSEDEYNQIFDNYKLDSSQKGKPFDVSQMFIRESFGKKFKELYKRRDQRRTSYHLKYPEIKGNILFKDDYQEKEWSSISPGERSDIILNIVLNAAAKRILIIDQPEDDLDNEMIFRSIVSKIRELKLKKQIIVVTHSANIAITGDSDVVVVCQNKEDSNTTVPDQDKETKFDIIHDVFESVKYHHYHSVNTDEMNDRIINIAALILDGGREALSRRVRKIGYKDLFFGKEID